MQLSRITLLAAALCVIAHFSLANGISSQITSGEAKTGTLSGESVDTYTFPAAAGGSMVAVVGETGVHDENFIIGFERTEPGGTSRGNWKTYFSKMEDQGTSAGNWTFKVGRAEHGSTGTGGYKFSVVQVPGAPGTVMSLGQSYDGTVGLGDIKVYTFAGAPGLARTVSLTRTGGNAYPPNMTVYDPSGALISGKGCGDTCEETVHTTAGTYTVLLTRYDEGMGDASAYRLSVNNAQ